MVLFLDPANVDEVVTALHDAGEHAYLIGQMQPLNTEGQSGNLVVGEGRFELIP